MSDGTYLLCSNELGIQVHSLTSTHFLTHSRNIDWVNLPIKIYLNFVDVFLLAALLI